MPKQRRELILDNYYSVPKNIKSANPGDSNLIKYLIIQ